MRNYTIKLKKVLIASTSMLAIVTSLPAWADDEENLLEEITVTAMKRNQSLQDVPMSISVVGEQSISERNIADLNDFLPTLAGVNFIDFGGGRNTIIVRGLAAQPQLEDKVVGTYFGEANISALGNVSGGGNGSANLKMVDIERIELLRGPQGTLYGSGSMGGTLRIMPNKPNLNEVEGSISAGFSNTAKFGGANSNQQVVLNLPIAEDRFAIRIVGYNYNDSGYVNNVAASNPAKLAAAAATGALVVNKDHIGATDTTGWRISALMKISDSIEITAMHAHQNMFMDGRPEVNLNLNDYEQVRWEIPGRGGEFLKDIFDVSNVTVNYDLGWATLVSSTSRIHEDSDTDRNFLGGDFWEFNPALVVNSTDNKVWSQEVRLVSASDKPFRYVIGYYHENFKQHREDVTLWLGTVDTNLFDPNGSNELGSFDDHEQIIQNSIFGELSYDISDKLTITAGGRQFNYSKHFTETFPVKGVFNLGLPEPEIRDAEESGQTFKAGIDYKPNEDLMVYAQWAQGFRLGNSLQPWPTSCDLDNDGLHDDLGLPRTTQIDSDSTDNYEVGAKWTTNNAQVNVTVFRTDWTGIPVNIGQDSACGFGVTINGGKARTSGVEIEGSYYASESLRIDFNASLVDAKLVSDVENVGVSGDRFPGSPKFSATLGIKYDFEMFERPSYIRSDYSYIGGFYGQIAEAGTKAGDYHLVNLNISTMIKDDLEASIYVKNLFDTNAIVWVDFFAPNATQMRPRLIGANLKYAF